MKTKTTESPKATAWRAFSITGGAICFTVSMFGIANVFFSADGWEQPMLGFVLYFAGALLGGTSALYGLLKK